MTDEPDDDDLYDGPCVVCGETVKGTRYFALGLFAAFAEDGRGLRFEPEDQPQDYAEWDSIPVTRCAHVCCMQLYYDGLMADLSCRRRGEAAE